MVGLAITAGAVAIAGVISFTAFTYAKKDDANATMVVALMAIAALALLAPVAFRFADAVVAANDAKELSCWVNGPFGMGIKCK